jgi:hypothetical protein
MTISRQRWRLSLYVLLFSTHVFGQNLSLTRAPLNLQNVGPVEWPKDERGNGHFYEAVTISEGISWADAQKYAASHGGYLATITSPRENTFIFKLINSPQFWLMSPNGNSWGPWLGGIYAPKMNPGGEPWQWVHHEGPFHYTNWSSLHDFESNQWNNGLIFFGPGVDNRQPVWNNLPANERLCGFVVEYDTNPVPVSLDDVAWDSVSIAGMVFLGGIVIYGIVWLLRRREDEVPNPGS